MSIEVRLMMPHEASLANDFFNTVYKTNRSFTNFEWEFFNGPSGPAIYIIAVDTKVITSVKVVGIQCAIPLDLISAEGVVIRTAKSEDTLVDPAYRGQKIFERMYDVLFDECRKAGIRYIWGFTPARKAFERIGFAIPFQGKQALMVFNPFAAFRYLKSLNPQNKTKQKFQIFGLSVLSYLKAVTSGSGGTTGYSIARADLSELDETFSRYYSGTTLFNLHATPSYLRWRIDQNPFNNDYRAFKVTFNGVSAAMVVVNFRREVSYIEHVLTKDEVHLRHALKLVVKEMRLSKPALIRCLCFDYNPALSSQYQQLESAGFVKLDKGNFFVWKSLDEPNAIQPTQLFLNRLFTQGNV